MKPVSNSPITGAAVIDASIAIAISAREANREQKANAELLRLSVVGYAFYAPGVIVAETLYILCGKVQNGLLTPAEHAQAVVDFEVLMAKIQPPPTGEASLVARAEAIRSGYGCSRSADGIYLALAEVLTASMPTVVLTFDQNMDKQASRNVPTVTIQPL